MIRIFLIIALISILVAWMGCTGDDLEGGFSVEKWWRQVLSGSLELPHIALINTGIVFEDTTVTVGFPYNPSAELHIDSSAHKYHLDKYGNRVETRYDKDGNAYVTIISKKTAWDGRVFTFIKPGVWFCPVCADTAFDEIRMYARCDTVETDSTGDDLEHYRRIIKKVSKTTYEKCFWLDVHICRSCGVMMRK